MAATICNVSFAKYNNNETVGIKLSTATSAAYEMGDVITPTGLDVGKKSATSVAARNAAAPTLGTDLIVAEPIDKGATYIVCYLTKADDYITVETAGSAS